MNCTHHLFKCVNNVYYCTLCGARIEPKEPEKEEPERKRKIGFVNDTEAEAPKKRRTAKKKEE